MFYEKEQADITSYECNINEEGGVVVPEGQFIKRKK